MLATLADDAEAAEMAAADLYTTAYGRTPAAGPRRAHLRPVIALTIPGEAMGYDRGTAWPRSKRLLPT